MKVVRPFSGAGSMTTTVGCGKRTYGQLRDIVEAYGGRMWYEREGYIYGAWLVELGTSLRVFESNGSGHPELDQLYVRRVVFPEHYTDYTLELVGDAGNVFLSMLK
jgi:hypothetical protein